MYSFLALPVHSYNMISDLMIIIHIYVSSRMNSKSNLEIIFWVKNLFELHKKFLGHSETVLRENYLVFIFQVENILFLIKVSLQKWIPDCYS